MAKVVCRADVETDGITTIVTGPGKMCKQLEKFLERGTFDEQFNFIKVLKIFLENDIILKIKKISFEKITGNGTKRQQNHQNQQN